MKFSKTFECFGICELTPESGLLYIPKGFAHGFLTLEDNCEITYKISNYYNQSSDVETELMQKCILNLVRILDYI